MVRYLRRNLRLQFSLRFLLLSFTGFAIGFPIWYRWPYEEVVLEPPAGSRNPVKHITTWQRQWGGGILKHGSERRVGLGMTITSTAYRQGRKHGPYSAYTRYGPSAPELHLITGQFANDLKEGTWVEDGGPLKRTTTWHHNRLHGPYDIESPQSNTIHMLFKNGELTHFNGKPAKSRLHYLIGTNTMDQTTIAALQQPAKYTFVQVPLNNAILSLALDYQITISQDVSLGKKAELPITAACEGMDVLSALTMFTLPHGLDCDYRYGCVWITTADDGESWRDPTGVAKITPLGGSALERAWNEIAPPLSMTQVPLAQALAFIEQPLAITIDASQIQPTSENPNRLLVTSYLRNLPLRHVLGQLLYQTNCRCRLEGDTLVIIPPDE